MSVIIIMSYLIIVGTCKPLRHNHNHNNVNDLLCVLANAVLVPVLSGPSHFKRASFEERLA